MSRRAWAWVAFAFSIGGCAAESEEPADSGAACDLGYPYTWDNWGEGFFVTYCNACHAASSPNRFGAPEAVQFDTLQQVRDQAARVEATVLDDGSMPVGGGVREGDIEALRVFLDCGL